MNCNHDTVVTLTAKATGKAKSFCGACLHELDAKPFVMPEGGLEAYDADKAEQVMAAPLTDWEREFLPSLAKMRSGPTEKQLAIWTKIVRKHFPDGIPAAAEIPF